MANKDRSGNRRDNRGKPARPASHPESLRLEERRARVAALDSPQARKKPRRKQGHAALIAAE